MRDWKRALDFLTVLLGGFCFGVQVKLSLQRERNVERRLRWLEGRVLAASLHTSSSSVGGRDDDREIQEDTTSGSEAVESVDRWMRDDEFESVELHDMLVGRGTVLTS